MYTFASGRLLILFSNFCLKNVNFTAKQAQLGGGNEGKDLFLSLVCIKQAVGFVGWFPF